MIKIKCLNICLVVVIATCAIALLLSSCSKEDAYKKFTEGGEIAYTGKLDSIKIYSGKNRVIIRGLLLADPKVTKCVIYWNNRVDSVVVPVTRTQNVDTLMVELKNLQEGVHNFIIYTYDNLGNESVPTYKAGRVYGERYSGTLLNRPINNAFTNEAGLTVIDWGAMDRLSGIFATDMTYTDASNQQRTIRVPIDSVATRLTDFKEKTSIQFRTLFRPDTLSVDTFYTTYTTKYIPKFSQTDLTATYIKNAGPNIRYSSINSANRWGILADWTSNAAINNASGFGSLELRSGVGNISMEAGWGLPNVTNGKIFQTITLPAGTYRFSIDMTEFNTGGSKFICVAAGTTLPDVSGVTGGSIGFANLEGKVMEFTLEETTQVSIGFVATLTAPSGEACTTRLNRLNCINWNICRCFYFSIK
ncbi:DUF4998 domain-containing protein [Niabella hibiscisoli]|uniref:DUF4998 domain-containing protein n=1 Tax=Niabella hibiscisoli TaxID=1825928 RepID=UPI001F106DAF|nr:DUF4998 domain-containing protein [Niabella hibiscisoli]MCH5716467.1 DUF5013 domain-containing protein [Niabella hibiscisoli]